MAATAERSAFVRGASAALAVGAVAAGVLQAIALRWTADDAYLSFRYARQWVHGHGLVFNPGERVEGYTNFLWTAWCALGMRLGVPPEPWADASGIACFAATLALLCRRSWRTTGPRALAVPAAAWMLAVHHDAACFATSGLETAAFCLLALAGYDRLSAGPPTTVRSAWAGALLAASALTRPDGVIFVGLGLAYLALAGGRRARTVVAYAAAAVVVLAPYLVWKASYYGDLLPNTYYAKSGGAGWYSQGTTYLALYLRRYPVLALGPPIAVAALLGRRRGDPVTPPTAGATGLALAFACVHAFAIVRVGGDFMFARMLLPATVFLLVAIEDGVGRLARRPDGLRLGLAAALAVAVGASASPLPAHDPVRGIVDERAFYRATNRDSVRALGDRLARSFERLPVRMAFTGGQAILAYESRADVALETAAGLTDRYIARQPLTRRGRVGHEKWTPLLYLIETKRADLVMFSSGWLSDSVGAYVPLVVGRIEGAPVTMLNWRPDVVDSLRARGAELPDFLPLLDRLIARLPALGDADARRAYEITRRFYFANVHDPAREAAFRQRLGVPAAGSPRRPGQPAAF